MNLNSAELPWIPGTYSVTASLENHTVITPKDGGGINVVISPNASNVNFTLAAYSISGTVKVMDYSGPSGAVVYCQTPTGTLQYSVDNSGKFRFYPLPAGQYRLWVEKNNYDTTSPAGGEYVFDLASWTTKNFTLKKR